MSTLKWLIRRGETHWHPSRATTRARTSLAPTMPTKRLGRLVHRRGEACPRPVMAWLLKEGGMDQNPMTRQERQLAWLALIAIGGIVYFVVAVLILHVLRPEYNPINHAVSNYAVGSYGYLMTAAFYTLALSVFALALGLARSIVLTNQARVALLFLNIASVGMIVMGIFPGDVHALHPPATITGVIHWTAAGASFASIMIAAFTLSRCFKTDERWQAFQRSTLVLAMAMVVALLAYGVLALVGWIGVGQRIYIAVSLMWLLFVAVVLRSIASISRHR